MSLAGARLDLIAEEHALGPGSVAQLESLLRSLAEDPLAPTTVTDPDRAVDTHVADALDALALGEVRRAQTIADLGAGAGIPGLPLAAALPGARVRLVESAGRKCEFIARAAAQAGIANAETVHARAEEWADGIGDNDVVTARALAPLGVLVEYAAPLLREGGMLVAWKAAVPEEEAADAKAAAQATGMELHRIHHQPRRPGASDRSLYIFQKVRATPERFPRRAGMARKRPISGPHE